MSDDATKSIRYNTLKREVDSNRTMYEELARKVREAGVISTMRATNLRVVDPAEPPAMPYRPDVLFNSALGLFAGLLIGLTFALVRESTNRNISAPGNTSLYLGVPELGVIPSTPKRLSLLSRSGASPATILQLNGRETNTRRYSRGQIEMASWEAPLSSIADSFRGIMTSLCLTEGSEARLGAIAISSAHPREGKTTVACNLAIALARTGKRVLLIDGDGRAPRIGSVFGLNANEDGLSELLASPGGMSPAALMPASARRTSPACSYCLPVLIRKQRLAISTQAGYRRCSPISRSSTMYAHRHAPAHAGARWPRLRPLGTQGERAPR